MTLTKGEQRQLDNIEDRLKAMETKVSRIQNIVIGIAIGIGIGGVVFGILSLKDIIQVVK